LPGCDDPRRGPVGGANNVRTWTGTAARIVTPRRPPSPLSNPCNCRLLEPQPRGCSGDGESLRRKCETGLSVRRRSCKYQSGIFNSLLRPPCSPVPPASVPTRTAIAAFTTDRVNPFGTWKAFDPPESLTPVPLAGRILLRAKVFPLRRHLLGENHLLQISPLRSTPPRLALAERRKGAHSAVRTPRWNLCHHVVAGRLSVAIVVGPATRPTHG
jgi:hypothetical protein